MGSRANGHDGVELPQAVSDRLAGKRFALIDFEALELNPIITVLDQSGAFSRSMSTSQIRAHSSALHSFDICLYQLSDQAIDGYLCGPPNTPALLVGTLDQILRQSVRYHGQTRDFLIKPWHPHDLLLRSFRLLQAARSREADDESIEAPTVIIADDDATTTALIAALLSKHQVKTLIARDGGEAIQAVNNSRAKVMVLDVNMPKLDGFEVLQAIKHPAAAARIKVAMLTSRQQETDIVRAFGLGADDYVVKPFNPLELVSRVKRLLRN